MAKNEAPAETNKRVVAPHESVDDLLAGFSVSEPSTTDPVVEARKARIADIESQVKSFAQSIADTTKGSDDEEAVKGALVSLKTVRSRAIKAAKSLPASAFGLDATPADEVELEAVPEEAAV